MSARRLSDINLLPKDSFEESNLGKTMKWILSTGRVVVVITHFAVIVAFVSRFWFDKRLNDLNDQVTQKQLVVRSFADIESRMRDILSKEEKIVMTINENLDVVGLIENLKKATPKDVSFSLAGFSGNGMNIEGKAKTEIGFALFLANLAKNPRIITVSLGETKYSQRGGSIDFKLSGVLSPGGGQK